MNFHIKQKGRKGDRDKSMIKLLKSPAIMSSAVPNTIFLSSDPDELCARLRLLLQEKHAGNNSDIINDEIVAIVDKLLEYKSITIKQHKQILIKCNLVQYLLFCNYMYLNIIIPIFVRILFFTNINV